MYTDIERGNSKCDLKAGNIFIELAIETDITVLYHLDISWFIFQDHLCSKEAGLTDDLATILSELTALNKAENAKVALRARQILIAAHTPPYDVRYNQMESIFFSAIDMYGPDFNPENLQVGS